FVCRFPTPVPPRSAPFPYTTLFRSSVVILANFLRDVPNELFESMRMDGAGHWRMVWSLVLPLTRPAVVTVAVYDALQVWNGFLRSEEHTSELQSRENLVCRLLLEKK